MSDMTRPTWICGCGVSHYVGAKDAGVYKCPYGCDQTFTVSNVDEVGNKTEVVPSAKKAKADAPAS